MALKPRSRTPNGTRRWKPTGEAREVNGPLRCIAVRPDYQKGRESPWIPGPLWLRLLGEVELLLEDPVALAIRPGGVEGVERDVLPAGGAVLVDTDRANDGVIGHARVDGGRANGLADGGHVTRRVGL